MSIKHLARRGLTCRHLKVKPQISGEGGISPFKCPEIQIDTASEDFNLNLNKCSSQASLNQSRLSNYEINSCKASEMKQKKRVLMQEIIFGLETRRGTGYSQIKQVQEQLENLNKEAEEIQRREKLTGWDNQSQVGDYLNLQNMSRAVKVSPRRTMSSRGTRNPKLNRDLPKTSDSLNILESYGSL